MLFLLKKAISYFLMPLPAALMLAVAGFWLLRGRRSARSGRACLAGGLFLLLFFGNSLISKSLIRSLEETHPPIPVLEKGGVPASLGQVRYIVVLGGGHADALALPPAQQLSTSALSRVTEAVRMARALPSARLVVSGPGEPGKPTHALVLERTAVSMGIDPGRIVRIEAVRDTEDEAAAVRALIADAPVALVTSAWHMPRAMALFRNAGVTATACPADYKAASETGGWRWRDLLFNSESLDRSTVAVKERIGYLWIKLRGKT